MINNILSPMRRLLLAAIVAVAFGIAPDAALATGCNTQSIHYDACRYNNSWGAYDWNGTSFMYPGDHPCTLHTCEQAAMQYFTYCAATCDEPGELSDDEVPQDP